MTSMNISLPQQMKEWVEAQVAEGRYHNSSEYIRDLIRKHQDEKEALQQLQAEIDRGRRGPFYERSFEEILESAQRKAKAQGVEISDED